MLKKRAVRWIGLLLALTLLGIGFSPTYRALRNLPRSLQLASGSHTDLPLRGSEWLSVRGRGASVWVDGHPLASDWQSLDHGVLRIAARTAGLAEVQLGLFGWLPLDSVSVDVEPAFSVVPGGQSIGVVLHSQGVMVVDEAVLQGRGGQQRRPAEEAGVRVGDVILQVGGVAVHTKEQAAQRINALARSGKAVALKVKRGAQTLTLTVHPVWDVRVQRYLVGVWIRDGASGVGTLTFFDPSSQRFAALGHVVSDSRTGEAYGVHDGTIVPALVTDIDRGRIGSPGEKVAVLVDGSHPLGALKSNTPVGIFGTLRRMPVGSRKAVPVALASQVHPGPATLRTVVHGRTPQNFAVTIERVTPQDRPEGKGLVLRVTDPALLKATGGIVQGMSGSPILQDGRLVGAVTHVFVDDPTRGYGVLAYWMAEEGGFLPAGEVQQALGS